jgi:hypothetical protein
VCSIASAGRVCSAPFPAVSASKPGPAVHGETASLPEAAVGLQQFDVLLDDRVEVRARNLLLAFDDPADRQRRRAARLAQGADRREPDSGLGLVVGSAAGVEPAVPKVGSNGGDSQSSIGSTGWTS